MSKFSSFRTVKIVLFSLLIIALITVVCWYVSTLDIAVLNPKGIVAEKQKDLIVFTTILGLSVIIPVFIMAAFIGIRYREGNKKAAYRPNWSTNKLAETIWWGIPIILITVLSVVTWNSTHELDPYKAINTDKNSVTIEVVALDWKWLFIYPDYDIATVNFIQFPTDTPVNFKITADAPMNSFWIPQLGGQIYAMPGMTTKLNLNATEPGDYKGVSANISGEGFAGMRFVARASSAVDFDSWVRTVKNSPVDLTSEEYTSLAKQTKNHPVTMYRSAKKNLYANIEMKYMTHSDSSSGHKPESSPDNIEQTDNNNTNLNEHTDHSMHTNMDHSTHMNMEKN